MQKLISKISIYQIKRVYEKEGKIKTRKKPYIKYKFHRKIILY